MAWLYDSSTGRLYNPDGKLVAAGYAGGNEGKNPEGVNNPDMDNVKKVGPIPVGTYAMGTALMQSHLGPLAIPLIPHPSNDMHERSGFYCHGDRSDAVQSASEGCIIMPRAVREVLAASIDRQLRVVRNV